MNLPRNVLTSLTAILLIPSALLAHAVIFPKTSAPGAYEKYVLRVPNEKGVPTTRVEIRFPAGVRIVSFSEVPGWQLEEIRDSANAVTGAVWTGTLPPERFVEFPFVAVNPASGILSWPVNQEYEGGERVDWTGAPDSERPASMTTIANVGKGGGGTLAIYLAATAVVMSLISLGLALRRAS